MRRPIVWSLLAFATPGCDWESWDSWEGPILFPGDLNVTGLDPGLQLDAGEVPQEAEIVLALDLDFQDDDASLHSEIPLTQDDSGAWQFTATHVETGRAGDVAFDALDPDPFPIHLSVALLVDGADASSTVADLVPLVSEFDIPGSGVGRVELWRTWLVQLAPEWELTGGSGSQTDPTLVGEAVAEPAS